MTHKHPAPYVSEFLSQWGMTYENLMEPETEAHLLRVHGLIIGLHRNYAMSPNLIHRIYGIDLEYAVNTLREHRIEMRGEGC